MAAHRLLHELVGPGRADQHATVLSHAALVRVLAAYPQPLHPPRPGTTYTTSQAASLLGIGPIHPADPVTPTRWTGSPSHSGCWRT